MILPRVGIVHQLKIIAFEIVYSDFLSAIQLIKSNIKNGVNTPSLEFAKLAPLNFTPAAFISCHVVSSDGTIHT